jgi:hypothetical protein
LACEEPAASILAAPIPVHGCKIKVDDDKYTIALTDLGALGLLGWRRKKKAQAAL